MKDFSPRQIKAIELLALGSQDYKEIAATVGVQAQTLRNWRRDIDFAEAVRRRALEHLKDQVPAVFSVLSKKAVAEEDLNAIRLLLERIDRAEGDLSIAAQGNVTFTWGSD